MYSYARHRLQEIEKQVRYMHDLERQFTQNRVTSLHNEAAAKNLPEVQRELLEGRYQIFVLARRLRHQLRSVCPANAPACSPFSMNT